MLERLDMDVKDLRILQSLYWSQRAAVRVEGDLTRFVKIKKGVRQGCVFSPDLFNLYSESVMKEIEDLHGIAIGGVNVNNVRYANDTALIADSNEKLQVIVDKLVTESEKKGL